MYMVYLCCTAASRLLIYVTAVTVLHLHILIYSPALLVLYSYFFWCVCVRVPAYWPSRVCGRKWGAEERWSMGAWGVAAEGSSWSTATRSGSCLCTDACRWCAGTYSGATGATSATTCVSCGAGENIYVDMYIYVYMYMYMFIPASRLLIYVTAVTLLHLHIFIYTPALLVLYYYFSWCVCVCACVCGACSRDACDMMAAYVYYPT
jgi:hypothetical protein